MLWVHQTVFHVTFGGKADVWGNCPCPNVEPCVTVRATDIDRQIVGPLHLRPTTGPKLWARHEALKGWGSALCRLKWTFFTEMLIATRLWFQFCSMLHVLKLCRKMLRTHTGLKVRWSCRQLQKWGGLIVRCDVYDDCVFVSCIIAAVRIQ